jgi:putative tricarboxylic transport membrane protein
LGLILAPMIEMSFRQSLSMSSGSYGIFFHRPIALVMLMVGLTLLLLGSFPFLVKRVGWRQQVGFASKESS